MALYYGGIEGGATKSEMVVVDGAGKILASSNGKATNHWLIGMDECMVRIKAMVEDAAQQLGSPDIQLESLGLSLSGADAPECKKEFMERLHAMGGAKQYYICTDTYGALATAAEYGVILIAGTGSNCRVINPDGSEANCGGWGDRIGDEGSAYSISNAAIKHVFNDHDNFAKPPFDVAYLKEAMFKYYNVKEHQEMIRHMYRDFDKTFYAGFATHVAQGAESGDPLCLDIFRENGKYLARHVSAVADKIHKDLTRDGVTLVCTGSVFKSWKFMQKSFTEYMQSCAVDKYCLRLLTTSAAIGAAFLGAKNINVVIPMNYDNSSTLLFKSW